MTKTSGIALDKSTEEWADLYARRLYNLAHFEAVAGTEREPGNPLRWFMLGESALARNRPVEAREAFAKAAGLIKAPGQLDLPATIRGNLGRAAERLTALIADNPILPAPAEPFRWIEDPDSIREDAVLRTAPGRTLDLKEIASHKPGSLVDEVEIYRAGEVALAGKKAGAEEKAPAQAPSPPRPEPAPQPRPQPQAAAPKPPVQRPEPSAPKPAQPAAAQAEPVPAPRVQQAGTADDAPQDPWKIWEQELLVALSRGKYEEARQRVDDAITRYPENTWLREHRAAVLERMGHKEAAARELAGVFEHLARKGDHRQAEKVARQAMALSRGNGAIILGLGTAAATAGMLALASDAFSLGVETERRSGDLMRLKNALDQAMKVFPGNASWRQELARLTMDKRRTAARGGRPEPAVSPVRDSGGGLVLPPAREGEERRSPPALQAVPPVRSEGGSVRNFETREADLLATFLAVFSVLVAALFSFGAGVGLIGWVLFFVLTALEKSGSFRPSPPGRNRLGIAKALLLVLAIIGTLSRPYLL